MITTLDTELLRRLGRYRPIDYDHARFEQLAQHCESPVERLFWSVAYFPLSKIGVITPQVDESPYRVDFSLAEIEEAPGLRIAIEVDGHDYHKSKEQRDHDYKRDRYLMARGWQIIRFTGSQVYNDPQACTHETVDLVRQYIYWLGFQEDNNER